MACRSGHPPGPGAPDGEGCGSNPRGSLLECTGPVDSRHLRDWRLGTLLGYDSSFAAHGVSGFIDLERGMDAFVTKMRQILPTPGVQKSGVPTGRGGGRSGSVFVPCFIPLTVRYTATSLPSP